MTDRVDVSLDRALVERFVPGAIAESLEAALDRYPEVIEEGRLDRFRAGFIGHRLDAKLIAEWLAYDVTPTTHQED